MKTKTASKSSKSSKRDNILAAQLRREVEIENDKKIGKRARALVAERDRMKESTGKIDPDRRQRLIFSAEARRQAMRAPSERIIDERGRVGAALRYVCDIDDFGRFARAALIDLIAKHDLTVAEFERQIGYSGGMVFMILRGERFVSYELVGRVLARFGWDDAQSISDWLLLSGETKL